MTKLTIERFLTMDRNFFVPNDFNGKPEYLFKILGIQEHGRLPIDDIRFPVAIVYKNDTGAFCLQQSDQYASEIVNHLNKLMRGEINYQAYFVCGKPVFNTLLTYQSLCYCWINRVINDDYKHTYTHLAVPEDDVVEWELAMIKDEMNYVRSLL